MIFLAGYSSLVQKDRMCKLLAALLSHWLQGQGGGGTKVWSWAWQWGWEERSDIGRSVGDGSRRRRRSWTMGRDRDEVVSRRIFDV